MNRSIAVGRLTPSLFDSLFNFTVPWLSVLLIIILALVSVILYYVPLRYLILAFIINKFTKRFRKPKGYVDNNEVADFISRLPSDPELVSLCSCDSVDVLFLLSSI